MIGWKPPCTCILMSWLRCQPSKPGVHVNPSRETFHANIRKFNIKMLCKCDKSMSGFKDSMQVKFFFVNDRYSLKMCWHCPCFGFLCSTMSTRPLRSSHGRPFSANRTHPDSPPKTATNGTKYPEIRQRGFYSDLLPNTTSDQLGVSWDKWLKAWQWIFLTVNLAQLGTSLTSHLSESSQIFS